MDQQFSLTWNNFHGNLTKGFAGLLGNGEFVDVTIAVDGHLLQAHKVILSICSPYFKKMFQVNPCQHPIVVLRDVSHKAMKDLLQFMYHGEVSVKREDLTTFISTAELLQIKGLTNKETDEEDHPKETNDECTTSNQSKNSETEVNEPFGTSKNEIAQTNELLKQKEFIEKLQRFSNLKRKSEEFLQNNYYSDIISEKRAKMRDRLLYNKPNNHMPHNSNFDTLNKFYEENFGDVTPYTHISKPTNLVKDTKEPREEKQNDSVELKTECEDLDVIVSDPVACTTPKDCDGMKDDKCELPLSLDYQSPQDNTTCMSLLFMDLKNIVNSKVPVYNNSVEEYPGSSTCHKLTTIPQKEDGKKKYPQRSCRLCWKIGRRRDTRFMCMSCELPFCKTPCFDFHLNEVRKMSQFQNDYYTS